MSLQNSLRNNQKRAIDTSIANDFKSGVHFHATGTGKSWIALELILQFNEKYKNKNVLWMCEQKSILIEQFSSKLLKERGYEDVFKKFHILNFSSHKQQDWFNSVNSSRFWGKSTLTIINRSFLTSNDKFKNLPLNTILSNILKVKTGTVYISLDRRIKKEKENIQENQKKHDLMMLSKYNIS